MSKVQWFCIFRWFHRKNHIKIYQTTNSFHSKKDLKLIKSDFFCSVKMKNSGNWIWRRFLIQSVIMIKRMMVNAIKAIPKFNPQGPPWGHIDPSLNYTFSHTFSLIFSLLTLMCSHTNYWQNLVSSGYLGRKLYTILFVCGQYDPIWYQICTYHGQIYILKFQVISK